MKKLKIVIWQDPQEMWGWKVKCGGEDMVLSATHYDMKRDAIQDFFAVIEIFGTELHGVDFTFEYQVTT